jgi:hypothetical protein
MLQRVAEQFAAKPPGWLLAPGEPTAVSLPVFAATVKRLAHETKTGRIGPFLVFISHVYETTRRRHPEWGLSMDQFKSRLKDAALANLVELAVANVMEPEWKGDLRRSRIDDGVRCWDVVKLAG